MQTKMRFFMIEVRYVFLMLFFLLGGTELLIAQENKEPVSYKHIAPEKVRAGDQFEVSVVFNIQPGWYVYAPTTFNQNQGKIGTKVSFKAPAGITVKDGLQLPEGMFSTYEGEGVTMKQHFQVDKETPPGKYTLTANVLYQTCNENMCYPPVREKVNVTINITK